MKRLGLFLYGIACYAVSLGTFLYAFGFIGNLWVPKALDGPPEMPFGAALTIDLALLGAFAVQHSVMARPAFKRWWTRFVSEPAERSTYVLLSSVALIALFYWWQPLGGEIWNVTAPTAVAALYAAYVAGWLLLFYTTFLINHFDLLGLRQVWLNLVGRPYTAVPFRTPWLYRQVRHPLYIGWMTIFWATPSMTLTHLVFALATTAYILIAVRFEEHDLVEAHPEYAEYRRQVPMLLPSRRGRVPQSRSAHP
jgi:protein-S-isoprenylcysteine O-methyltransferase Ste14